MKRRKFIQGVGAALLSMNLLLFTKPVEPPALYLDTTKVRNAIKISFYDPSSVRVVFDGKEITGLTDGQLMSEPEEHTTEWMESEAFTHLQLYGVAYMAVENGDDDES
ncbi:hypothetical protein LCGC14_0424970 [marine sediment metagenome]|uniref:Uncharacterized protein n=1 Tax=marine sediment metagenome TaxID=412755 RepID=A0A0F9SPW2_9ZZZZ